MRSAGACRLEGHVGCHCRKDEVYARRHLRQGHDSYGRPRRARGELLDPACLGEEDIEGVDLDPVLGERRREARCDFAKAEESRFFLSHQWNYEGNLMGRPAAGCR